MARLEKIRKPSNTIARNLATIPFMQPSSLSTPLLVSLYTATCLPLLLSQNHATVITSLRYAVGAIGSAAMTRVIVDGGDERLVLVGDGRVLLEFVEEALMRHIVSAMPVVLQKA